MLHQVFDIFNAHDRAGVEAAAPLTGEEVAVVIHFYFCVDDVNFDIVKINIGNSIFDVGADKTAGERGCVDIDELDVRLLISSDGASKSAGSL